MKKSLFTIVFFIMVLVFSGVSIAKKADCVKCHSKATPKLVEDWKLSKHSEEDVMCSSCHGDKHNSSKNVRRVEFPDERTCGECHEEQFGQFVKGKHNKGWKALNALPITHIEPDILMEGGKGCGGCHNMGLKTAADKKEKRRQGYRYQNNSCDECHTRHTFSKKEAQNPRACQQCHMGYDHPQWEMWESSKHGSRWFTKNESGLSEKASAPTCQFCHLPNGTHTNSTAWGFFGVRLPLPKDKQWAADRVTILKAIGILNPKTGNPTNRLDAVKELDFARLTQKAWKDERNKMLKACKNCHSGKYARKQLEMGDESIKKADRLMAQAIEIVAGLYKDGIIRKPKNYPFAYPDFLYFMRTGGGNIKKLSHIEQVLFEMFMKHRMRTYQGVFHANPDYAYWYGWGMMTKDLGKIQELAKTMRAVHKK